MKGADGNENFLRFYAQPIRYHVNRNDLYMVFARVMSANAFLTEVGQVPALSVNLAKAERMANGTTLVRLELILVF
jgi:hypothetical protein